MNQEGKIKILISLVLFLVWAILCAIGKTEVQPIVDFIKMALGGMAVHYLHQPKGDSK